MILKVSVIKNGANIFSVDINVRDQNELPTGVKVALDEFHRVNPSTSLLDGKVQITLDKA